MPALPKKIGIAFKVDKQKSKQLDQKKNRLAEEELHGQEALEAEKLLSQI